MSKPNLMKDYQRVRNTLLLARQTCFKLQITITKDQLGLFMRFKYGNEVKDKRKMGGWAHLGTKRNECVAIDLRDE